MLRQTVTNRRPDALRGLGVIALTALAVIAGSAFFTRLGPTLGSAASMGFLLYGAAIAWFLLNWYVMGFVYTANDDCLRVCRFYGKRERFMADVWLNQLLASGTEEEMKRRFPGATVSHATKPQCPLEPLALAYRENGKTAILVIQPDDAIREHLEKAMKKARK